MNERGGERAVAAHVDDATLVRWLDGEATADERAHVAGCAACAARAAALDARRARLTALLAAADVPVPPLPAYATAAFSGMGPREGVARPARPARSTPGSAPWRGAPPARGARWRTRLAAAGVLVVAAGVSAQPVRRWVAERWARWTASPRAIEEARSGPARARPAGASLVVAFTPEPGPFTVQFDVRPAGGALVVRTGPGAQATATATGGGDLLVLPAGLRVRNAPEGAGDYTLVVPARVGRVRVHFAAPNGGAPGPGAPARDTVLDLAGRATVVLPFARAQGMR